MRTNPRYAVAWIGASILAIVVSSAAVASVRSNVTDRPVSIGAPPEALAAQADVSPPTSSAPTTRAPEFGDDISTSSTVPEPEDDTEVDGGATSTTSTTPPPPPTTTTTAVANSYGKTYETDGGSVRIEVSGDSVVYKSAVPNSGWTIDVEHTGPEKVDVEFKRHDGDGDREIHFKATVEDGELKITIEEED